MCALFELNHRHWDNNEFPAAASYELDERLELELAGGDAFLQHSSLRAGLLHSPLSLT
jgi:hypothetical protein